MIAYPPARSMETQIDRQRRLAAMADMAERITQDLKNPLGSLALYASILRRELQGDDDMTRITGLMISAIQSMDHFLDSYATFSSMPSPRLGPVNISAWLDDTAKQLEMMNMGKGIRVKTRYDHVHPEIYADRDLLSRLSLNLVLNAVQGMPQGGDLTIATCTMSPFEPGREFLRSGLSIPAKALPRRTGRGFSTLFLPPARKETGWDWPLSIVSSRPIMGIWR